VAASADVERVPLPAPLSFGSGGWTATLYGFVELDVMSDSTQFTCAFPDVLHGFVFATGNEPQQPTRLSGHPTAGLYLHDLVDQANSFEGMLPACARQLTQNGCTVKTCDKQTMANQSLVTAYPVPALGQPASTQCVSFNGCPANAPVVWCSTNMNAPPNHYTQSADSVWIKKVFWDFIDKH
jgi:hypothetical protein